MAYRNVTLLLKSVMISNFLPLYSHCGIVFYTVTFKIKKITAISLSNVLSTAFIHSFLVLKKKQNKKVTNNEKRHQMSPDYFATLCNFTVAL